MIFEQGKPTEKAGERAGYVAGYFLFTTALFLLLVLLGRIPESWSYLHVMGITILIALVGAAVKRFLR